jgi:hypothetical protein
MKKEEGQAGTKKTHTDALAKFITRPQADLKSAQSVRITKSLWHVKQVCGDHHNYQVLPPSIASSSYPQTTIY